MGETEWKHAGWVSAIGKWAWIILFVLGIIHVIYGIATTIPAIILWQQAKAAWDLAFPGTPYPVAMPGIGVLIWNIIGAVISIFVALIIIRPKFSKPCGEKDWEALYGWTLKLGANIPWMFIWGIVYVIFGFWYFPGIFILLPAIMLIFAGPRKYEW